jgi:outer membrane protein assembly factor BamE (lipoprotein component of BamABCDE complex)
MAPSPLIVRASRTALAAALALAATLVPACSSTPPIGKDPLTDGMISMTLRKGVTTQAEVLKVFGAPNIVTRDGDGRTMWTYRRHSVVTRATGSQGWVGAGGAPPSAVVGIAASAYASDAGQTNSSMTLIIKFDTSDKVIDFQSMSSQF